MIGGWLDKSGWLVGGVTGVTVTATARERKGGHRLTARALLDQDLESVDVQFGDGYRFRIWTRPCQAAYNEAHTPGSTRRGPEE